MRLKKIGILSAALTGGVLYGLVGLIGGVLVSVITISGVQSGSDDTISTGAGFGIGAVIILPIIYSIAGTLVSAFVALLYNFTATVTGGLELDLE